MKKLKIAALLILAIPTSAFSINKCTDAAGKITFTDTACPQSQNWENLSPPSKSDTATSNHSGTNAATLPSPETVEFTGDGGIDILKASAIMENIRVLGRDCEWALKVDKTKISSCISFMGKLQPEGQYQQTTARVLEMIEDRTFTESNMPEINTIKNNMQAIVKHKEFMLQNLNN